MKCGKIIAYCCGMALFAGLAICGLKTYIHIGDPSTSGISDVHYRIVYDIARDFLNEEFDRQIIGLDETSKLRLRTIFNQIYGFGYYSDGEFGKHAKIWENEEKPFYYRYINRAADVMDSFYFEHGLRFASQKIKDYVANKDILIVGSETYNPAIALNIYTSGKIFCIGKTPQSKFVWPKLSDNVRSRCTFIDALLGAKGTNLEDAKDDIMHSITASPGDIISVVNGTYKNIETLDSLFANKSTKIGFIRMRNYINVRYENSEDPLINAIKGGIELIKKNRPVMSISYCHSRDSLLKMKPFLDGILDNYVFEIQRHGYKNESTAVIFCYPKELL